MSNVIEGFEYLSKQMMFDMALAHIRSTRTRSVDKATGQCVYSGSGCAASVFLTEEAKQQLQSTWHCLVIDGRVPDHEVEFVQVLQRAHDNDMRWDGKTFMDRYESAMYNISKIYDLYYMPEDV